MKYVHTTQQIADVVSGGSFTRDKWNELMILFGVVPESFHRSPFSVVAALVPLAHEMVKRSRPFADEASKLHRRVVKVEAGRKTGSGCSAT